MAQFLKKTIFAVAGSGKTTQLVNMLDGNQRFLLLTYTENNCKNLCALVENKFGHIPENISISTYFSFLFSFCIRPFIIEDRQKIQGLFFDPIPEKMKYARGLVRYISAGGYIYHSRALDLNRNFPGKVDGTETEKIAFAITQEVEKHEADYIIDLHESRRSYSDSDPLLGDLLIYGNVDSSLFCYDLVNEFNKINSVKRIIEETGGKQIPSGFIFLPIFFYITTRLESPNLVLILASRGKDVSL